MVPFLPPSSRAHLRLFFTHFMQSGSAVVSWWGFFVGWGFLDFCCCCFCFGLGFFNFIFCLQV